MTDDPSTIPETSFAPGAPEGAAPRPQASATRRPPSVIHFEQAVYGSFAFRSDGYALLAQSPGCRSEWLADFRAACRQLGEKPTGTADSPGLFALRLASGPWVIVGVSPQGRDDCGRPGALAFHGLFVSPRDYRRAGADPFALAPWLRSEWSEETRELPAGTVEVQPEPAENDSEPEPRARAFATAIAHRRRVAVESAGPIDDLARRVWRALPIRVRARASVATWAFGNDNRFDLLAVPRLSGVALDRSYVDPSTFATEIADHFTMLIRLAVGVGLASILGASAVSLLLLGEGDDLDHQPSPPPKSSVAVVAPPPVRRPAASSGGLDEPGERQRVAEALDALMERFGDVLDPPIRSKDLATDPTEAMERLARGLRYRGPLLSDLERDRLRAEISRAAALALRWDALIHMFADDRPLPDDFRRLTLRDQLDSLLGSFHKELAAEPDGPRPTPSEAVHALGEALAVDFPVRPTPLAASYPALGPYMSFLSRLPRR